MSKQDNVPAALYRARCARPTVQTLITALGRVVSALEKSPVTHADLRGAAEALRTARTTTESGLRDVQEQIDRAVDGLC